MALTGRRLRELRKEELRALPLDRLSGPGPDSVERDRRMASGAPWALLAGWVAFIALAVAIEPAPTRPEAAQPLWPGLWGIALMGALVATGVGLARRERSGFVASAVAGGVALFGAVMCPVSGHHAVGAWWFVQMAGFAALGALSLAGLRLPRTKP
ncbi:MAG TPA: hypothetical protein VK988_06630 [Acidimicrobiales bacterium]|nr:hypothetical protein [Acidimicrobiales bacterium]